MLFKTDKKYKLFYLADNCNIKKLVSLKMPEEITAFTVYVSNINNPGERSFDLIYGTKYGSVYY